MIPLDTPLQFESDLLATFFSGTHHSDGYALISGTGAGAIRVEDGRPWFGTDVTVSRARSLRTLSSPSVRLFDSISSQARISLVCGRLRRAFM